MSKVIKIDTKFLNKKNKKFKKTMNQDLQKNQTKLTINGKIFQAENNQTILQACEKIGLFIPRFCYNEALSIAGNCRMCLVEIEKSPKLMPACAIKIANDMKIYTKTNIVKKARESILEFLLINHPLDCPICDQGGECDLQDQAMVYGSDRGRFYEYKRSLQDKNAGPLIKTIMTRCIHCTRCIRYATEIAGIEVFGTTGRGKSMEVGTYISNLFNSEISGNVIDLCPVGALTSKPYAFSVRPWELKNIESIDLFDAVGSNIRIDTRGSEIMRILPKSNDKINQQWISDKTRFAYDGLKCQRLYFPMIKKDSKFLTVSWNKALETITKKIKETKSNNIGGIIGHFIDQETIITLKKCLNQLGINNYYVELNNAFISNKTNNNNDLRSNFLSSFNSEHFEDQNYDTILFIGTNTRYEASMLNVRLRQTIIKKKYKEIDIISLGSPINYTFKNKQLGTNLESLWLLTQGKSQYTKKILKSYNPIALLSNYTIERQDGKSIKFMLNNIFNLWTKINNTTKISKRLTHTITKKIRSNIFLNNKTNNSTNNNRLHVLQTIASLPGTLDLGFISNKEKNKKNLDFVYLVGADCKNLNFNDNAFIVYQGHHGCLGAKKANVILPSTSFTEKKGTYLNFQGYIQQTQKVINSDHEIYHDWQIIQKIANNLNINGIFNKTQWIKELPLNNNNLFNNFIREYKNLLNQNILQKYTLKQKNIKKKKLQLILNNLLNNYFQFNLNSINSKIIKQNDINISHNFNTTFKTIAPYLNNLDNKYTQTIYPKKLNIKKNNKNYHILYKTFIKYDRDNFYLSDIITKASITMGKCSALFKTSNFIL